MSIFILEDDPNRIEAFKHHFIGFTYTIATNTNDGVKILNEQGPFDIYFLDHDLGPTPMIETEGYDTGSEVLRQGDIPTLFHDGTITVIHSLNPHGAAHMASLLPYEPEITPFIHFEWDDIRRNIEAFT